MSIGRGAGEVLVGDAFIRLRKIRPDDSRCPVRESSVMSKKVRVRVEQRETTLDSNGHVGVEEEQVGALPAREVKQFVSIVFEIDPRSFMKFAGNVAERLLDERDGLVVGTGIHDDPATDEIFDRVEAAFDDRRFIAHDHRENESVIRRCSHKMIPCNIGA